MPVFALLRSDQLRIFSEEDVFCIQVLSSNRTKLRVETEDQVFNSEDEEIRSCQKEISLFIYLFFQIIYSENLRLLNYDFFEIRCFRFFYCLSLFLLIFSFSFTLLFFLLRFIFSFFLSLSFCLFLFSDSLFFFKLFNML